MSSAFYRSKKRSRHSLESSHSSTLDFANNLSVKQRIYKNQSNNYNSNNSVDKTLSSSSSLSSFRGYHQYKNLLTSSPLLASNPRNDNNIEILQISDTYKSNNIKSNNLSSNGNYDSFDYNSLIPSNYLSKNPNQVYNERDDCNYIGNKLVNKKMNKNDMILYNNNIDLNSAPIITLDETALTRIDQIFQCINTPLRGPWSCGTRANAKITSSRGHPPCAVSVV